MLVLFVPFLLARYVFSMYKDLQENYLQTITSFSTAIETKDPYTNGHSRRVEFYSGIISEELGLSRSTASCCATRRCSTISARSPWMNPSCRRPAR